MYDKFYEGQGISFSRKMFNPKIVSIRLSSEELSILNQLYPNRSVSWAIRTLIRKAHRKES